MPTYNGLKSPSEQQRLLVLLAEKKNRTTTDEKTLSALIRAEKTDRESSRSKSQSNGNHSGRTEGSREGRNERRGIMNSHKAAGLMIVAGLVDSKTGKPKFSAAELVGALAGI
ncbi:hypothetical protein GR07_28540, partial [Escherichia coli]